MRTTTRAALVALPLLAASAASATTFDDRGAARAFSSCERGAPR